MAEGAKKKKQRQREWGSKWGKNMFLFQKHSSSHNYNTWMPLCSLQKPFYLVFEMCTPWMFPLVSSVRTQARCHFIRKPLQVFRAGSGTLASPTTIQGSVLRNMCVKLTWFGGYIFFISKSFKFYKKRNNSITNIHITHHWETLQG